MELNENGDTSLDLIKILNAVDYSNDEYYIPSPFALKFAQFIQLVNGPEGEENTTPTVHLRMLDALIELQDPNLSYNRFVQLINLCHRGLGKTTVYAEYFFPFLAVFGEIPNFGKLNSALYVADSMDGGAKRLRENIESRYERSDFLQKFLPKIKFTDKKLEFTNIDGEKFAVLLFGVKTGVRGTKIYGSRPKLAVLDDLLSDEDAMSDAVKAKIRDVIDKAIPPALHTEYKMIIWSGTPFDQSDPLYEAVESGAYRVNVYPVCEKFPCSREEFRGSWEDRFDYDFVFHAYDTMRKKKNLAAFYQEYMLRVVNEEDALVKHIPTYDYYAVKANLHNMNLYIATDFASTGKEHSDLSPIFAFAVNSNGQYLLLAGDIEVRTMDVSIQELFKWVREYRPLEVGIETTGQQGAYIDIIKREMAITNTWFTFAKNIGAPAKQEGMRSSKDKTSRFLTTVLPLFRAGKILFPDIWESSPAFVELNEELTFMTRRGPKSKYDDCLDILNQMSEIEVVIPTSYTTDEFSEFENSYEPNTSYIV